MWIVAIVVGLFALLLLSNLRFVFSYTEEKGFSIVLRFLFLRFSLTDKRPKKEKHKKKKNKKPNKRPSRDTEPVEPEFKRPASPLGFSDIKYSLKILRSFLKFVLKKASRYVKIRFKRLHITVAGEDAALAAIEYGAVISLVSYFTALTEETPYLKGQRKDAFSVSVDYLDRHWQFFLLGEVKCRVLFAIPLLLSLLRRALSSLSLWRRRKRGSVPDNEY